MTRYVIDAPTLLHIVREPIMVHPAHQLVGPNLIRSQPLTLLLGQAREVVPTADLDAISRA